MEAGHTISKEDLFWQTQTQKRVDFEIREVPSFLELERQFRAAKPHKSMGMDCVPAELLHAAPRQLTYHLWPWFAKQAFTTGMNPGVANFTRGYLKDTSFIELTRALICT